MDTDTTTPAPATEVRARAEAHLRALVGRDDAVLREDQWTAIEALAVDRRRALVVQRTGWGKSAVYFVATALLREPGRRPDRDRLAAARPDAQPDRGRRARRHPRGHHQLHQHRGVGADPGRDPRPARSTCCWSAPSGSTTPASATRCCRGSRPPAACWWSTRRTASPTGATTSGPTTAGSAPCSATCPTASRCSPRPRPPTPGSPPTSPSSSGRTATCLVLRGSLDRESLRLGVVRLQDRRAAAGLARRPPRRAARLGHRLLPHRRGHPGDRRLPALAAGTTVAAYSGQTEPDRAAGARGGPARRPGQGAGRHQRARHGLRRDARLRGQPGRPAVAGRLLPAGRPRRPRHRRGHGRAAAGDRGPRHLGTTSPPSPSRARSWCARPSAALADEGRADEHRRAGDPRRAQPHPARDDAQGARRRRCRAPGPRRLGGHRPAVGLRRGALPPGAPRPASASSRRCSTTSTPTGAGCGSCATSSTTPRPPSAGAATTAAASTLSAEVSEAAVEEAGGPAVAARRRRSSRARCGRRALATSASSSRARSPTARARAGRSPG